jgi:hypothetical protein
MKRVVLHTLVSPFFNLALSPYAGPLLFIALLSDTRP